MNKLAQELHQLVIADCNKSAVFFPAHSNSGDEDYAETISSQASPKAIPNFQEDDKDEFEHPEFIVFSPETHSIDETDVLKPMMIQKAATEGCSISEKNEENDDSEEKDSSKFKAVPKRRNHSRHLKLCPLDN